MSREPGDRARGSERGRDWRGNRNSGLGSKPRAQPSARHLDDGLPCRAQEDGVEERRCVQGEDMERRRNGEDGVEVGNVEDLGATVVEPCSASFGATGRAMTIAAGVPEDLLEAAAVTVIAMTAESGRAAIGQSWHGPELMRRERMSGVKLGCLGPDDRAK